VLGEEGVLATRCNKCIIIAQFTGAPQVNTHNTIQHNTHNTTQPQHNTTQHSELVLTGFQLASVIVEPLVWILFFFALLSCMWEKLLFFANVFRV
jgi:hypothetical protein